MGRDRKPVEVKDLHGNASKAAARGKPVSQTGPPSPPTDLRGEGYAEWCRVTSYLASVGRIELIDHAALVVYVTAWASYNDARRIMEEKGVLILNRDGGYVRNPAAMVMQNAADTMLRYGAKFGFTPRDRINLGIAAEDDGADAMARELDSL